VRQLPAADATIQITLNGKEFAPGAPVKVQVEASQDGYMVVFQVDGGGRIRVLFPLDPDLDAFVRGGKRYELRSQGNKQSFLADDRGGSGVVYAAISRRPLSFGLFAVNARWDYETIRLRDQDSDVEAELNAIVGRMGDNVRFDYDIVGYRVYDTSIIAGGGGVSGYVDPFYDPYWSCLACGWGYGSGLYVNVGFGGYWGYGYPYYPYYPYYNYPYYPYYPYYGGGGGYPGYYPPINVVPLPRPPTAAAYGYRARARQPQALPAPLDKAFAPDLTRTMRPESRSGGGTATPQGTYTGRARPRGSDVAQGRATSGGDRRETSPSSSSAPASGRSAPSSAPPSGGSTRSGGASGSGSSGGYDDRSRRRPELSNDVTRRTFEATASARAASTQQPIFREPRRESTVDRSRTGSSQRFPVYREPPRAERASPAYGSAPQSAPRSAPQSGARSAPQSAPQMGRSSPPSQGSAPASSPNQGRSRGRPN
jgi:hypothetical protein